MSDEQQFDRFELDLTIINGESEELALEGAGYVGAHSLSEGTYDLCTDLEKARWALRHFTRLLGKALGQDLTYVEMGDKFTVRLPELTDEDRKRLDATPIRITRYEP